MKERESVNINPEFKDGFDISIYDSGDSIHPNEKSILRIELIYTPKWRVIKRLFLKIKINRL